MSEANRISFEIVTHDGVALKEIVDELTAPSVSGDFGVLPGHRPLLAALRTGIATYRNGNEETRIAVGPGFAQVGESKVVLLTDRFCRKDEIDPITVRQELAEADQALDAFDGALGGPEHGQLLRRSRWAAAQLELYGDPPPPTVQTFSEFQTVSHPNYALSSDTESESSTEDN